MRHALVAYLVLVVIAGSAAMAAGDASAPPPNGAPPAGQSPPPGTTEPRRPSRAIGLPHRGRLRGGVQLAAEGTHHFTWDGVRDRTPNRGWRRWGTDRLVDTVLRVLEEHRLANPGAPRVGVGDLSRRRGGDFGPRFGGLGHASHQNGLDVDILYPRRDRLELAPDGAGQVDRRLAQDLVDRFVAAGAERVFVGPRVRLGGRRGVVERLAHHDDHLHVRISG